MKDVHVNYMKKFTAAFLVLILVGFIFNVFVCCAESRKGRRLPINVAGIELEVELAITPEELSTGLMYRDRLDDNQGMLFVFSKERILSFWMKDTRVPLSIAFIKANGRIVQIESMKPYNLDSHVSKEMVKYALEMKDGWFANHKVKEGDIVKIPPIMN